jgi:uncharacterized OB-fold protein
MKLINQTRRCSSCGCISFPDSRVCPKCGKSHIETGLASTEPAVEKIKAYSEAFQGIASINRNIIINIRDNITISVADHELVQIN